MEKPLPGDYPSYFNGYIQKVEQENVPDLVNTLSHPLTYFFLNLPEEKAMYRYASDKWTLKDMLQHIIDTERIMQYRLLRIARNDKTPLPGFDENQYAVSADANKRSFVELKEEFKALRKSTDLLLKSLTECQLQQTGNASNHPITANAIAFIIFGHLLHHKHIIEERYL